MAVIKLGEVFRDAKPSFLGHSRDWTVETLFVATDGNEYARLCSSANRHEQKTLAAAILQDKRRFIRIASATLSQGAS